MIAAIFGLIPGILGLYHILMNILWDASFDPEAKAEEDLRYATRRVEKVH
jgi:hypothetical protein